MEDGVIKGTVMFAMRPWIGSCKQTMARMSGHLEHDLAPREERRVTRHLARCHRCHAVFQSLVRAVEQLRALGRDDTSRPDYSIADLVTERIRHDRE